nr:hypothetical protein [Tanacetum cinerariifolium]
MATTIKQQVALDEALVPSAQRLRIGRSNFRLPSDIQSKEPTLQVVYDVLRRSPFFRAFPVTADVPEIYMQEFWATATVHQHSIRFKMDTKKHIVDLESFREMLHISPRVSGQSFAELPFEEEILEFLRLSAAAKGKQPARSRSPTKPSDVERTKAEQLKIVLRRSRHETHISQQESDEGDDEATESDRESEDKETREREEESFDPIPRTPEDSEDDDNNEEDQGLRIGEEERMHEKEEADKLYPSQLPTPPTPIPSLDLQSLPTFTSVFRFEDRVKLLEVNFSNILGIVNQYMHQQMPEAVREAVQTQTDRLQDSIQRENDEFPKTIDDNMKKIIKEQVKTQVKAQVTRILPIIKEYVNAQLEAEVLTRSSHYLRTSYVVVADLSEMELKKILIDKMEGNKSIQRSDEQQNLYKALVEAYDADKTILDTYGESAILKRRREDDDQEGPSAGSDQGRLPTLDRDWNKSLPAAQGNAQSWISALAKQTDARSSFNELLDTPIDFSNFIMNWLSVDTLTPELLAGPTYELMRGSCISLTELEYHLEEVYKATTDQLDWVNPEGQQYPHNLLQPLSLIPDNRGRRVIPFEHFINNGLEYLQGGASSRKYITSVTKTKAEDYGHIKWIDDLVPRVMWIQEPINYDKHTLWGVSHWGRKRQQFYGFAV